MKEKTEKSSCLKSHKSPGRDQQNMTCCLQPIFGLLLKIPVHMKALVTQSDVTGPFHGQSIPDFSRALHGLRRTEHCGGERGSTAASGVCTAGLGSACPANLNTTKQPCFLIMDTAQKQRLLCPAWDTMKCIHLQS